MRGFRFFIAGLLLLSARHAFAAECVLTETSGGSFSGTASGPSQVASLSVTCDSEYRLGLDAGAWSSGTRRLQNGTGSFIAYRLWQDKSGSQEWGDSGLSSSTYAATPLSAAAGPPATHPIFGSLSDAASAPPGDYSDTVRVTLAWPPYGAADQQTATLSVSFSQSEQCSLDVSGIKGFGAWPIGGDDISGVSLGTVSVSCADGLAYAVGINAGENYDGSSRRLKNGADYVPYTLRATSSGGPEWGDTGMTAIASDYVATHPAQAVIGTGNGAAQTISLWGDAKIPNVTAGQYADRVNITLVW